MKHAATSPVRLDAQNRGVRSLYQGLVIDLLVAVGVALAMWLPDADLATGTAWLILGTAVVKSALQALAAFLMRLKLDGSAIPTPLPPEYAGQPSDPTNG